jgi:hypothetical protein
MKNWDIIQDWWNDRMYINWAYFLHRPIKGNLEDRVRKLIRSEINTLYKLSLILSRPQCNEE